MKLDSDLEDLLQGALDGTLTDEERQRLERVLTTDTDACNRLAELRRLFDVLESVGGADAPPAFAKGVLAEIAAKGSASAIRDGRIKAFPIDAPATRSPSIRRGISMNRRIVVGLAAAAVVVLAVASYFQNPPVNEGTEATIGAAQRYQAPQIEAKDVAVGDTSAQALMQTETWDAIVKDETLRTLLQDASFRAKLQDAELRKGLADAELMRALRAPSVARALVDPEMAKRFNDPELMRRLSDPELLRRLNDPEYAKKLDDAEMKKLIGDPELIRRLADADLRTALRSRAIVSALQDAGIRARLADVNVLAALSRPAFQAALRDSGFAAALRGTWDLAAR
jgi:anti-sigma-K factor RskA